MKGQPPDLPEITLRPQQRDHIRFLHPWIYKSQIQSVSEGAKPGCEVLVRSPKGSFIGVGYYNPATEIAVRIVSRQQKPLDRSFFQERFRAAVQYRNSLRINSNALRWVNSESDQLPGLIVDQYADTVVLQFLTRGMDERREMILDVAQALLGPRCVYERSDGVYRRLEGVEIRKGWLRGNGPTRIEIKEGEIRYWVDIAEGHKTGFYLDQRENRAFVQGDWTGRRVLDCFTYTGGFAIAFAKRGAKQVVGVDLSEASLDLAKENANLNGVVSCEFHKDNVFDYLRRCEANGESFDAVILDPPSFTRSKGSLDKARKGYKEIHLRALKILEAGGLLLTFCCSHHVKTDDFQRMVLEASKDAHCGLKIREWLYQAKDHPVMLSIPETLYLKGLALIKTT